MSSTHTASLAADFPAENSLTGLPNEILRKILEVDFNLPKLSSKIILVSNNGEEHAHQLLTGERGRLAGVSKYFSDTVRNLDHFDPTNLELRKVHVDHLGGSEFFFNSDAAIVQAGVESDPEGWGLDRYQPFIESNKNDIHTLVLITSGSANDTLLTLKALRHWATVDNQEGKLFPKLRCIKLLQDEERDVVLREDEVSTRSRGSTESTESHATRAQKVLRAAIMLANSLNDPQTRPLGGPNQVVVSRMNIAGAVWPRSLRLA